jgi:hypothetical protein
MTFNSTAKLFIALYAMTITSSCGILAPLYKPATETKPVLDIEVKLRQDIPGFAQSFEGTKYRYAGRTPNGFDCSGLVLYVMKEFNINMSASSSAQEKQGTKIDPKDAKPGDLVFFRRTKNGSVFHVALVLSNTDGELTIIHSTSSRGVVIDEIQKSSYWRSKYMTARDVIKENAINKPEELPLP